MTILGHLDFISEDFQMIEAPDILLLVSLLCESHLPVKEITEVQIVVSASPGGRDQHVTKVSATINLVICLRAGQAM